jgi:diguanylate cyclase (GGDEF)-like protein
MRITFPLHYVFVVFILFFNILASASGYGTDVDTIAPALIKDKPIEINKLMIDPRLLMLIERINHLDNTMNLEEVDRNLSSLAIQSSTFNPAERYLYLLATALFIDKKRMLQPPTLNLKRKAEEIISVLSETKDLSKLISESQQSQPIFLQAHQLLAKQHVLLEQFDLAYQETRAYLNKYSQYRYTKREAMLKLLTEDFNINEKISLNDALTKQNEMKIQRVDEVQKDKQTQQNNFILIIGTALAFVALFFQQLKVRHKLIELAKTDVLTGVLNRNALFEHGYVMANHFTQSKYDFSVLLLDLDNFKRINDHYGHHVGDQVLTEIAKLVNETMRSRDVFSRLGGEEFVALLPYADHNKAKAIAQRINDKVASYNFIASGVHEEVTLSIGVATMVHHATSFEGILHCADLAMYQAKAQGKNCIFSYQNIPSEQERRGI